MEQLLIISIPTSIQNNWDDKYFFVKSSNYFYRHFLGGGAFFLLHPVIVLIVILQWIWLLLFIFSFVGECKSIPDCEEGELEDFPRRMREWLFNVMEELADRGQLTPHFSKLHKEGEVELISFSVSLTFE